MKQNQAQALKLIGLSEGGYVNDPNDPGGETDRGITQRTFDAWNASKGRQKRPVKGITKEEAEEIIVSEYFTTVNFNSLPGGIDYAVADFGVHSGPAKAVKVLQKILGLTQDGIAGAMTIAAASKINASLLIDEYMNARLAYMKTLRTWKYYGKGWSSRVDSVRSNAKKIAAGGTPTVSESEKSVEKARESDVSQSSIVAKIIKDPMAILAGAAPVLAAVADGQGPVSYAIGIAITAVVLFVIYRQIKAKS